MTPVRVGFWLLLLVLLSIGAGGAFLRHRSMEIPLLPGEERPVWLVEARVDFVASGGPVRVNLDLPENIPGFRIFMERAASPGYGFSILTTRGDRRGEWTKRGVKGRQTLYYSVQFVATSDRDPPEIEGKPPAPRPFFFEEPAATAAKQVVSIAEARSSNPQSLVRELVTLLDSAEQKQNAALLLEQGLGRAVLLERLLNQAGVAARVSLGLELEDARRRRLLRPLLEVPVDGRWLHFDPATGEQGLPEDTLLWHRGGSSLLDVEGATGSSVAFSMLRQTVPALEFAYSDFGDSAFASFSVSGLPIEEQSMFKLLFLLPLGALVIVFLRLVVGLRTSGTFMPILIALAFVQTSLPLGLSSFVVLVAVGLVLRSYLSSLDLLLVARIASLIVIVILLISLFSLVGYRMGISTGLTITFFPTVIIAWTIERMSILWEEEGPFEVASQGGGSLLAAVLAYLVMEQRVVQHLTFNFPELNLIVLAVILLIGQYTGYRLSELARFRQLDGWS